MATTSKRPPRLCRTPEECFAAGQADAADDPPLTRAQIDKLAVLWRPTFARLRAEAEAEQLRTAS